MRDWWSTKTEKAYDKRSECFIREYDKFKEPKTGLFVNGVDTQGENLADNGGLRMAFKAYKNYLAKNGEQDDPLLPGKMSSYTSNQLFFMSFASVSLQITRMSTKCLISCLSVPLDLVRK